MSNEHKPLILRHLKEIGPITAMDAEERYGCRRLAARIEELRKSGYSIRTDMETSTNRYGKPIRYAKYTLEEDTHEQH